MPTGALPTTDRHSRGLSTQSTLFSPTSPTASFLVSEKQHGLRSLSSFRLAALAACTLGVQIFWSMLMAHGTPYLQSLGFSSSLTSLVWLAGPLGGALVQPVVGVWSDKYAPQKGSWTADWGRRTPFLLFGTLGTIICLLGLANVKETFEFLGMVAGLSSYKIREGVSSWAVKAVAIGWVYLLNILIQPLQVGVRTFVVDNVPSHQQVDASAWISRWNSLGAVMAYWLGSLNLPAIVPIIGSTQFKALSVIETLVLLITVPASIMAASGLEERAMVSGSGKSSLKEIWRGLYRTYKVMPRTSWTVCKVQFWAWLAWFPFLYYNTLYIGSLTTPANPPEGFEASDVMISMGEIMSARSPKISASEAASLAAQTGSFSSFLFALLSLIFTLVLPALTRTVPSITVERLWLSAHVLFAIIMASTFFVSSVSAGTALVACLGFSWAMTQWAPFALISGEVSRVEEQAVEDREAGWETSPTTSAGAGAVFGLHNVAIAGPQVIAAIECAALFKLLGMLGVEDVLGCVLKIAGLAALGAAWAARKLVR